MFLNARFSLLSLSSFLFVYSSFFAMISLAKAERVQVKARGSASFQKWTPLFRQKAISIAFQVAVDEVCSRIIEQNKLHPFKKELQKFLLKQSQNYVHSFRVLSEYRLKHRYIISLSVNVEKTFLMNNLLKNKNIFKLRKSLKKLRKSLKKLKN